MPRGAKGKLKVAKESAAEQTPDPKSYLDSIVSTLTVPIPLVIALGWAAYSLATKPGPQEVPEVSIAGTKIPFPLAAVMVMVLNGFLLIHVGRMTWRLRKLLGEKETEKKTARVLLEHAGMLNPFAGYEQWPGLIAWVVNVTPKIAVGFLIGFYAMFVLSIGDSGAQFWGTWFLLVALVATLIHTVGVATSMLGIMWLAFDLRGFLFCIPYLLGLLAGVCVGFVVQGALST